MPLGAPGAVAAAIRDYHELQCLRITDDFASSMRWPVGIGDYHESQFQRISDDFVSSMRRTESACPPMRRMRMVAFLARAW